MSRRADRRSQDGGDPAATACPCCGRRHDAEERICRRCGVPLELRTAGVPPAPRRAWEREMQARARLVDPSLALGPPVRVATVENLAEAELVQALLLDAGIPSMVRRAGGFDVPDFLAAGPRDVLVPAAAAAAAEEVLGDKARNTRHAAAIDAPRRAGAPWPRLAALTLVALLATAAAAALALALLDST